MKTTYPISKKTSSKTSSALLSIALTLTLLSSHTANAGRALPSSTGGTRGGAASSATNNDASRAAAAAAPSTSWFASGSSILNTFRSLKEDNKKDGIGDDCWGWEDDWTDDRYKPCWDGTFKYELDPSAPPDRCNWFDPGDNTDDWTEVCEEWYATYGECSEEGQTADACKGAKDADAPLCCNGFVCADDKSGKCVVHCAAEKEEARKCGSKDDDDADECCGGLICGDDNKCVALPKCAAPGDEAVGCGAAEGLFAADCCDGLVCSMDGDEKCVVPPPPLDCVDSTSSFIYQTGSGFQRTVKCEDVRFGEQCGESIVGNEGYTVISYCPVTCRDECALRTEAPTPARISPSPTASPVKVATASIAKSPTASTASPTESPVVEAPERSDQSLIPFHTYAIELIIPNASSNRRRAQENRAPLSLDEDELERITAEHVDQALSKLGEGYASSDIDMEKVGEYAKLDSIVVAYSLTGVARFEGSDFASLPSRSDVDEAIMNAFEGDESYVSSLQASSDPIIASVVDATVKEMDEPPPSPVIEDSDSEARSNENESSVPVGVIAAVAAVAGTLAIAFAVGIYRSRSSRRNGRNKKTYASSSGPLSNQADSFNSPGKSNGKKNISNGKFDEISVSDGSSRFSALEKESIAYSDVGGQGNNSVIPRDGISVSDDSYLNDDGSRIAASMVGDASVTYSIDPSYMGGDEQSTTSGSAGQMSALGDERCRSVTSYDAGAQTDVGSVTSDAFNEVWKDQEGSEIEEDKALQFHKYPAPKKPGSALSGSELATIQDISMNQTEETSDEEEPEWAKGVIEGTSM